MQLPCFTNDDPEEKMTPHFRQPVHVFHVPFLVKEGVYIVFFFFLISVI